MPSSRHTQSIIVPIHSPTLEVLPFIDPTAPTTGLRILRNFVPKSRVHRQGQLKPRHVRCHPQFRLYFWSYAHIFRFHIRKVHDKAKLVKSLRGFLH